MDEGRAPIRAPKSNEDENGSLCNDGPRHSTPPCVSDDAISRSGRGGGIDHSLRSVHCKITKGGGVEVKTHKYSLFSYVHLLLIYLCPLLGTTLPYAPHVLPVSLRGDPFCEENEQCVGPREAQPVSNAHISSVACNFSSGALFSLCLDFLSPLGLVGFRSANPKKY